MAIFSDFDTNLNIISQLADQPNLSAAALKAKFDEAGNTIQTWLNETLKPWLEDLAAGTELGVKAVKTANLDDAAVTSAKIAAGGVASSNLAAQTKIVLSGSDIYGNSLPASGVTGQIFFKKVT